MSRVICGFTFEQYIEFHHAFTLLAQNGASVEDMVEFLKRHGQEPVWEEGEEGESLSTEYYMMAGLKPWEDVIAKDPELAGNKTMALLDKANAQVHGDLEENSGIEIAGLSLEGYAELCATYSSHSDDETAAEAALTPLFAKHGVRDKSHFDEINKEFCASFQADETGHLSSHYGRLFMRFQPQHAANMAARIGEAVVAGQGRLEAAEKNEEYLHLKLREMSENSSPEEIARLVRDTYPENADDEEFLDRSPRRVVEHLYVEEEFEQVKVLLAARFEILQPGGDREEWVAEQFEELGVFRLGADRKEIETTDFDKTNTGRGEKSSLYGMKVTSSGTWISIVVVLIIAIAIMLLK